MRRIRERVAGLDVHRDTVMAATWVLDRMTGEIVEDQEQFSTMTSGIVRLGRWLLDHGVTTVGMEATGDYWKPVVRHEAPCDRAEVKLLRLQAVAAAC